MPNITLICSTHNERGRCTAEAFLDILRTIGPELAFVEIRPADFDAYKRGTLSILEARVIARYQGSKPCSEVPVDRYNVRADLLPRMKFEFDQVIDYVGRTSEEYRRLDQEHAKKMDEQGFAYLNSDAYAAREARMSEIEETLVRETGDAGAIRVLNWWRQHHRSREVGMVASIYEYCRANRCDVGVFLVGAAHRAGIVREIDKYASTDAHVIDWTFYGGQVP